MMEKLQHLGLSVDLEGLREVFPRATLGRRHLAEWLTRTGQVSSQREAFALSRRPRPGDRAETASRLGRGDRDNC